MNRTTKYLLSPPAFQGSRCLSVGFSLFVALVLMSKAAYSQQFVVTDMQLNNPNSLDVAINKAVTAANAGNQVNILFNVSGGLVLVDDQLPTLNNNSGSITLKPHPSATVPQGLEFVPSLSASLTEGLRIQNWAGSSVAVENLTINGFASGSAMSAIRLANAGLVIVENCQLTNNDVGIDADYAQKLFVLDCDFTDNSLYALRYQNSLGSAASIVSIDQNEISSTGPSSGILIEVNRVDNGDVGLVGNTIDISGVADYGISVINNVPNTQTDPLLGIRVVGNTLTGFKNLRLTNPLLYWVVEENSFYSPGGTDMTILSTASNQDNIYGIHFVETPQIITYASNNIKNDFGKSGARTSVLVDGFFREGVRIIGYNGAVNTATSPSYSSSVLPAPVEVRNGYRTLIRANNLASDPADPDHAIILKNMGNDKIASPAIIEAKLCSPLLSIKYGLPVFPFDAAGLKPLNGEYEVDFYKADVNGNLLHHLGNHHITVLPNFTPLVHVKVIQLANVPGLPSMSATDRIAVTVTSVGTGNLLGSIGTSEADYSDIEECPVAFFSAQDVCFVSPLVSTPLTNLSCAPLGSSYEWDFDDGTPVISAIFPTAPNHTYTASGTYLIELTVTAPLGCSNSYSVEVDVVDPPIATFTYSSTFTGQSITFTPDYNAGVSYDWNLGDGSTSTKLSPVNVYYNPGQYSITLTVVNSTGCAATYTEIIDVVNDASCCVTGVPVPGIETSTLENLGTFYLDKSTGQIVYQKYNCPALYPFVCLSGKRVTEPIQVVSASAVTFSDDWKYREEIYYPENKFSQLPNAYEKGERGKWRPEKQYVYREKLDALIAGSGDPTDYKNADRGTFPMVIYDWKNEDLNNRNKWVLTSTTTKYTPNGEPVEDENILGIRSTAKYGYKHTLPVLVAQNADDNSVAYESFENLYESNGFFENKLVYDNTTGTSVANSTTSWESQSAHTGKYSIRLTPGGSSPFPVARMQVTDQLIAEGILVRLWLQINPEKVDLVSPNQGQSKINILTADNALNWSFDQIEMSKVSNAGQWTLYEAILASADISGFTDGDELNLGILIDFNGYTGGDIYLDDVRVQPLQSEMVCYVYDESQRLVAVFDDQHYAMIYQYNQEGVLVRKLKETVEGIKTISETQYNTVGETR